MRRPLLVLLPVLFAPLPGCCAISRFFCGPDKTAWISQRFDTPQRTVQTLFEAVRRDDPQAIWLCLGERYRQELRVDSATFQLAWQRIREQNHGLHVAGYTDVPPATPLDPPDPERARVTVDVAGTIVDVDLERQAFWEVFYRRDNGTLGEPGGPIGSFAGRATIETAPGGRTESSRLVIAPLEFRHEGTTEVPLASIEHAALTRRWKITQIRSREPR